MRPSYQHIREPSAPSSLQDWRKGSTLAETADRDQALDEQEDLKVCPTQEDEQELAIERASKLTNVVAEHLQCLQEALEKKPDIKKEAKKDEMNEEENATTGQHNKTEGKQGKHKQYHGLVFCKLSHL